MRGVAARLVLSTLACLAFAATPTPADSWVAPREATYYSRGREFRLRVFPRVLSSPGDYWHQYDQGPGKRGQAAGQRDVCLGQLEKQARDGSYGVVWKRTLVNDVSPVAALVTSDGSHVVTFDNWHNMGYGGDVIVIYGPEGKLVASLGLSGFLSTEQIARLPRTMSSIQWGGAHHFDETEKHLVVLVAAGNHEGAGAPADWRSVVLSLEDGHVQGADEH